MFYNGSSFRTLDGAPKQYFQEIWGPADDRSITYLVGWDGALVRMSGGPSFSSGPVFTAYACVTRRRLDTIWGAPRSVPGPDAGSSR